VRNLKDSTDRVIDRLQKQGGDSASDDGPSNNQ
jgi:hypothetical protein